MPSSIVWPCGLTQLEQSRCSAFYGWPHRCCFRITLPSPRLLPQQHVCHGSSVWPCSLTQLEQSRCSAYGWPRRSCFRTSYFAISTPAVSAAGVPWFFSLALRPYSAIWQSHCSAYLWLAAPLLLSDYFAISTLAASAAGVPWFFSLALRPHSTRAIALLSLWLAAPFLLSDKLLCHLHTCCLGNS